MTSASLPPEDQPSGQGLIPVSDQEAIAATEEENPAGSAAAVGAAFHYALTGQDSPAREYLRELVTLESVPYWGDFAWAREMLAGTGMMSRSDEPAPGVAYVRYVTDTGQSLRADGDFMLTARAIATLVYSQDNERWQVHALGEPVLPENLPASLF